MARSSKIIQRLALLENEFGWLLRQEFQKVSLGGRSSYLNRKEPRFSDGRRYCDDETGRIEYLEKEVRQLSMKMGALSSSITLIDEYAGKVQDYLADRRSMAREYLAKLQNPE